MEVFQDEGFVPSHRSGRMSPSIAPSIRHPPGPAARAGSPQAAVGYRGTAL